MVLHDLAGTMVASAVGLAALLATAPAAGAAGTDEAGVRGGWRPSVAVSLGSRHVGGDTDYEEVNPGLSASLDYAFAGSRWEVGAEAGFYRNSFARRTVFAVATTTARVAHWGDGRELRLGVFAGLAEYANLREEYDRAGVPTAGDFVPVAGLQAVLRAEDGFELRARVAPPPDDAAAVIAFQIGYRF